MQQAREKLDQLDAATSAAQGWLRGMTTRQRLAALTTFASAYPKLPEPAPKATAPVPAPEAERVKAANPLAILTQGLWQAKPHDQVHSPMPLSHTIPPQSVLVFLALLSCLRLYNKAEHWQEARSDRSDCLKVLSIPRR